MPDESVGEQRRSLCPDSVRNRNVHHMRRLPRDKPRLHRSPHKTLGESTLSVGAPTLLEQRDCLCRQARHLAQIRPTEPRLPSATLVIGVRQCRSWLKTRQYFDEHMYVCLGHLIPVLLSPSLTSHPFPLRPTLRKPPYNFLPPPH